MTKKEQRYIETLQCKLTALWFDKNIDRDTKRREIAALTWAIRNLKGMITARTKVGVDARDARHHTQLPGRTVGVPETIQENV